MYTQREQQTVYHQSNSQNTGNIKVMGKYITPKAFVPRKKKKHLKNYVRKKMEYFLCVIHTVFLMGLKVKHPLTCFII